MKMTVPLVALLATTAVAPAAAETVVVTADRMVDVLAGKSIDKPVVVITDGRIVAVGREGAVAVPQGAKRIELPGRTILPGLIDMHVHLEGHPKYSGYNGLEFTDSFWPIQATYNARAMLDAGFTTVRNVGANNYTDVGLKEAIAEGWIEGPRIIPAGHALGATGGHCDETFMPPSYKRLGEGVADGPEGLRQKVREQKKYGAEVIKICATGGVFSRGDEPGQQQLTAAELEAIADEAHMAGMKVAAHAHGATGIKAAIRAGIDTIEHASLIDDEGIALAKKAGTWLTMDIFNTDYTQSEGAKNGVLEDNLRKDREIAQIQRDNFRKAHAAGVRMLFGTDAGVMPHGTAGGQFKYMVQYGMTPMEAIQAATKSGAMALGREKDVGAIAVGRYGDIIAVDGDPLNDVRALEHVDVVIKGGKVVKAD